MKIRNSYVSNSSSSSFIVSKDLTDKGIACLKLTEAQKTLINGSKVYGETIILNLTKDFWLTQFISDCDEERYGIITDNEHHEYIFYSEGELGGDGPYAPEYFNEYPIDGDRSVFIYKEHDEAKQMSFNKFVKDFKATYSNSDVIVKYNSDHEILLTIVGV